ncbi:MAG: hypothetical protein PHU25_15765 [Deltaproteobacteria bacterium]|nr:hypothetical protein [Deltaproteobacteria bacterium]
MNHFGMLRVWGVGVVLAALLISGSALGWTTVSLRTVEVDLQVAAEGPSTSTSRARFEVEGGKFHGFELGDLPAAEIDGAACSARTDDGIAYGLVFKPVKPGETRVLLANGAHLERGGITFTIVHKVNLTRAGALRKYEGRARLSWTPLVWDEGSDSMTVRVALPGPSGDAPVIADPDVSRDYEVTTSATGASLTKYRSPRWYPMQVALDFDPSLVRDLPASVAAAALQAPVAMVAPARNPGSRSLSDLAVPALFGLFGLFVLAWKAHRLHRVLGDLGIAARFRVLGRTGLVLRLSLSLAGLGLAVGAEKAGSMAAAVPPLACVAFLWIVRREEGTLRPRAGGTWRAMDDHDVVLYRRLTRAYRRSRRSWLDATVPGGAIAFVLFLVALGFGAHRAGGSSTDLAWGTVLNGLLLAMPAWWSRVKSELPLDPTLESFSAIRRWRKPVARLLGTACPGSEVSLWVREDGAGPVEVRLRVEPAPAGLRGLELAGEIVRSGSTLRVRQAVVLRLDPGTDAARRLAALEHAVEHHLSPDLSEEMVVLHDRRGAIDSGTTPLRLALGALTAG